ncbi:MAG: TIGR01777 family oxidoreductase [Candidatus Nanopelagicales bacterium]|nr:TIGR01777 family oxidoreductase [Candidatus Nanopelagicales bacterium]
MKQLRVAITGASGLIGSDLAATLTDDGHRVIKMVRRAPSAPDEVRWDPDSGEVDLAGLSGVDAIVHLAGAGVGDHRWTDSYKTEILNSRVNGTQAMARAAAQLDPKPAVFLCASAIGYYGDRGDLELDEDSSKGVGFLSDVVADWEQACEPARQAGIRVVNTRTGLVVSERGGAWEKLLKQFKLGAGGRLGSGNQYQAFISLRDEVRALEFLINHGSLDGPVNLTAPNPVTNKVSTQALASLLGKPAIIPAPAFALKIALGEFASDVLSSARVLPKKLEKAGFHWDDPTIHDALKQII